MSDSLCVGVCMFDPETGVCMGCGRSAEEIDGTAAPEDESVEPPARQAAGAAAGDGGE